MRYETLEYLRCPSGCETELEPIHDEQHGEQILAGKLVCVGCGREYPVTDGIARMLPQTLHAPEVPDDLETERKRSEMAARDAQVEDYDKMRGLAFFSKIEIPVTLAQMNLRPDDVLLEAGCGTGRMTPIFAARCQSQIAVDFSFESLRVCRRKLQKANVENVDLVQADVCALPFRADVFRKLVSCQVLEHIPTPESRARMISELARVTKPGGNVVLSAYQHSLFTRLFGQKEGMHDGGIYYYRFGRRELKDLLARHLEVQSMTGALVYHYLARCQKSKIDRTNRISRKFIMSDIENVPVRPERKATIKLGQRELSRISLAVVLLIVTGLLFGVYRLFMGFKSQRDITVSQANLRAIHVALSNYAQDWNERLPPAERWQETLALYLPASGSGSGSRASVFQAQGDDGAVGYVYNELAAGYNLEPKRDDDRQKLVAPNQLVLVIEKANAPLNAHVLIPAQGSAQGETALFHALEFPHYAADPEKATTVVLFANGSVLRRTKQDYAETTKK